MNTNVGASFVKKTGDNGEALPFIPGDILKGTVYVDNSKCETDRDDVTHLQVSILGLEHTKVVFRGRKVGKQKSAGTVRKLHDFRGGGGRLQRSKRYEFPFELPLLGDETDGSVRHKLPSSYRLGKVEICYWLEVRFLYNGGGVDGRGVREVGTEEEEAQRMGDAALYKIFVFI
eukprot:g14411.t1